MKFSSTLVILLNAIILSGFVILLININSVVALITTPVFLVLILLPVLIVTLIGLVIFYNARVKRRWNTSDIAERLIWTPIANMVITSSMFLLRVL